jgi:hypothetical protein
MRAFLFSGFILISLSVFSQSNLKQSSDTLQYLNPDTLYQNSSNEKIVYDTIVIPVCYSTKGSAITYEKIVRPRRDTVAIKQKSIIVTSTKED